MRKLILLFGCMAALTAHADESANVVQAASQTALMQQAVAPQSDLRKLHAAVMAATDIFEEKNIVSEEGTIEEEVSSEGKTEQEIKSHFERKMNSLPPKRSRLIRKQYAEADSMSKGFFLIYWYMVDALQKNLSALSPLADAESEGLRQKWLEHAVQAEKRFMRCGMRSCTELNDWNIDDLKLDKVHVESLLEDISTVFRKNGLRDID